MPRLGGFKICSNKVCSPLAPLTGAILERFYFDSSMDLKCSDCKAVYDKKMVCEAQNTAEPVCYKCKKPLIPQKKWVLKCPSCGQWY